MSEQRKVPKLRFPEFTDDWEQRKFGDIGAVAMCRRILKHQTSDYGDIPFYKIGTFGGTPDAYISKELFEEFKARYPYPDKGDILISASGSIGRTVEFTGQNEYFQDSNIVWLKHDKSIINPFLRHLYEVVKWASIEGSTIKRLYNDNILKTEIIIPSVQEQTKIAEMLDGIDNHITLHQRKCEVLKKLKKGLLQKMFPKDGTNIPEIRFPEFSDAWERRKLGDGMTEYTDRVYIEDSEIYNQVSVKNIGEICLRGQQLGANIGRKRQAKVNLDTHPNTLIFTRQTIEQGGIGFAPEETNGAIVTENMPTIDVNTQILHRFT